MAIQELFNPRSQHNQSGFVPIEVLHEITTGIPGVAQTRVSRCEDIRQVLDIRILRDDPSGFLEVRSARISTTQ